MTDASSVDLGELQNAPSIQLRFFLILFRINYLNFEIMQPQHTDLVTGTGSLNLTPEEKRVFGQLFRQADREGLGVVTGEVAVKFFERTRLEPRILGEVSISRTLSCIALASYSSRKSELLHADQ